MVLQTNSPREAKEMLSTKTRNIIIAGLASLSFAATTAAPAVSQAQAISPQGKAKAVACEILKSAGKVWQELGEKAEAKNETDNAAYYFDMRDKVEGEAGNMGCLWEIEIDAVKAAAKVKAIKAIPAATLPVTTKTTTSTSTTVVSTVSAK
jgi:hypothetical protein